ncbi:MAG: T9SS type A sorting domain-containing protein [Calditrichaeota bacterium]|nr:T9SS type A sorting domain-containing protein [Calditrichota bacterium]
MKYLLILLLSATILLVVSIQNTPAVPPTRYLYLTDLETTRYDEIVWFWTYDSLYGPVRSNDYIGLKGSPHFFGQVTTSQNRFLYNDPQNIYFEHEPIFNAPPFMFPRRFPNLIRMASPTIHDDNGRLMTRIVMRAEDGIDVHQYPLGRGSPEPNEEDNLIMRLEAQGTRIIYIDGKCEIYGVMIGRMTIYSTGDMYLIDNILYEGANPNTADFDEDEMEHMLGLVSERNIIIKDNNRNGRRNGFGEYSPNQIDHHSISINGSLLALSESFTFEHQNDDWEMYQGPTPDERGIIYLKGSLTQVRRGYLHRSNHGGTGYGTHYRFDERLSEQTPLGLEPDEKEYFGRYDSLTISEGRHSIWNLNVGKLIVQPGADICLRRGEALIVRDSMFVLGTADEPVIFRADPRDSSMINLWDFTPFVHIQHAQFDSAVSIRFYSDNTNVENCTINGRIVAAGDVRFVNNTFSAAMDFERCRSVLIESCLIKDGLKFKEYVGEGRVSNNTIVDSQSRAGIEVRYFGSFEIVNNIIAYNHKGIWRRAGNYEPELRYNDVFGSWREDNWVYCDAGEGSISADPLFVDAANCDYRLSWGSPCIDAGDPDSPRNPDGSRADMGAFYFHVNSVNEAQEALPSTFSVTAFPNPFNSRTSLKIETDVSGLAYLKVYDLTGREVISDVKTVSTGASSFSIDSRNLDAAGVYFARVMIAGERQMVKLLYLP